MLLDYLKTAFVTLLVTIDPPGLAPIFIGLTAGMARAQKREVALRAVLIALRRLHVRATPSCAISTIKTGTRNARRISLYLLTRLLRRLRWIRSRPLLERSTQRMTVKPRNTR